MAELHRIVSEELPKFDGKAVVLTGQPSGGAFCAGSDVNCHVEFSSPQDGLKAQFNMFSLREIYNSRSRIIISKTPYSNPETISL